MTATMGSSTPSTDPSDEGHSSGKLSTASRSLFALGLPTAFAGLAYASPPTAAIAPVLVTPTVLAARQIWRLPPSEAGDFNTATWTYLGSGLTGPVLVGLVQTVVSIVALKLFFGPQAGTYLKEFQRSTLEGVSTEVIAQRRLFAKDPRSIVILALISYPLAGVLEEAFKYLALRLAMWRTKPNHEREYLIYATAAGIGFATIENLLFVYAGIKGGEVATQVALTALERTVFAIVGHGATAAMVGLRSIHRDSRKDKMSFWEVISRPALYHGTFDFMLFCVSAWNGNVGWIHPTDVVSNVVMFGLGILIQGTLVVDLWKGIKEVRLRPCSQT